MPAPDCARSEVGELLVGLGAGGHQRLVTLHLLKRMHLVRAGALELRAGLRDPRLLLGQLGRATHDIRSTCGNRCARLLQHGLVLPAVEPHERLPDATVWLSATQRFCHITGHLWRNGHDIGVKVGIVRALDEAADSTSARRRRRPQSAATAPIDSSRTRRREPALATGVVDLLHIFARDHGIHGYRIPQLFQSVQICHLEKMCQLVYFHFA